MINKYLLNVMEIVKKIVCADVPSTSYTVGLSNEYTKGYVRFGLVNSKSDNLIKDFINKKADYVQMFTGTISQQLMVNSEINQSEKELKTISNKMIEGLVPNLSMAQMLIDSINTEDNELRNRVRGIILKTIDDIKSMTNVILPYHLNDIGIYDVLKQYTNQESNTNNISIDFKIPKFSLEFQNNCTIHLYRIIQEAIQNSIKHSDCKNISLEFFEKDNYLVTQINDDGKGIDCNTIGLFSHFNSKFLMKTLINRALMISSDVEIKSKKNRGTTVNVYIPINTQ